MNCRGLFLLWAFAAHPLIARAEPDAPAESQPAASQATETTPDQPSAQPGDLQRFGQLNASIEQLTRGGRFADAVPVAEQFVALARRMRGDQHVDTALALHQLGFCLLMSGNAAA